MEKVSEIEFWRSKAHDYEWMYKEQRNIADGYRQIIHDLIDSKKITTADTSKCQENILKYGENMV